MLEPSDRIRLIREIAQRLGAEEWALVDLTLRQFGLPTTDAWSGTIGAYVITMLDRAPDEALVNLGRHVGFEHDSKRPKVEPDFWLPGRMRLFISHLAAFREEAASLQYALRRHEISAFVAHNDIAPTAEWQDVILSALATADAMVVLMRDGFHESNWTDQEIGYAMGRGILVVTVRLGPDPYGFIGRFQALNGNGKEMTLLALELFEIFRTHKQTRRRMTEALVSDFELADSFAMAKSAVSKLEQAVYWDDSLSERCRTAVQSNSQVSGSFGVPERLERRIAKWEKERLTSR
jgi:TIR domain